MHVRPPALNAEIQVKMDKLGQVIVDDPAPGSMHAMEVGLVPAT